MFPLNSNIVSQKHSETFKHLQESSTNYASINIRLVYFVDSVWVLRIRLGHFPSAFETLGFQSFIPCPITSIASTFPYSDHMLPVSLWGWKRNYDQAKAEDKEITGLARTPEVSCRGLARSQRAGCRSQFGLWQAHCDAPCAMVRSAVVGWAAGFLPVGWGFITFWYSKPL